MSIDIDQVLEEQLVERHSYFQLKHFVVGKEPTNQSKMWRCLTELKTRKDTIEAIKEEIKRIESNNYSEKQVKILNRKLVNVQQEAQFFEESFRSIEKIEALKPYDDYDSQLEYWNEKLLEELNLKLLLRQPIDIEQVKIIMTLDDKAPVKKTMVKILQSVHDQVKMIEKK